MGARVDLTNIAEALELLDVAERLESSSCFVDANVLLYAIDESYRTITSQHRGCAPHWRAVAVSESPGKRSEHSSASRHIPRLWSTLSRQTRRGQAMKNSLDAPACWIRPLVRAPPAFWGNC